MPSLHGGSRLGTRFGPYELNSLIGVGGMGEVYRAYDTVKDRTVAVKVLRAEMAADPGFQERFRRESRVAARLQEPHVIPVHDFGDIDGVLYIDMRLVEGASLKDELRANGPLDPSRAASIIAQVAAALDAAHSGGLVHRDIKPENVLLTPDDFAYLVDFGIAHGGGDPSMTTTGLVIGSCAYMSAERFNGEQVGPPADVYSLTCLLYESLTGRPPFETGDLRQLMIAHMFAPTRGRASCAAESAARSTTSSPRAWPRSPRNASPPQANWPRRRRLRRRGPMCRPHRLLCRVRRRTPGNSQRCSRIRQAPATCRTRRRFGRPRNRSGNRGSAPPKWRWSWRRSRCSAWRWFSLRS